MVGAGLRRKLSFLFLETLRFVSESVKKNRRLRKARSLHCKSVNSCFLGNHFEACHSERSQPTGCPQFAATRRRNGFAEFKGLTRRVAAEHSEESQHFHPTGKYRDSSLGRLGDLAQNDSSFGCGWKAALRYPAAVFVLSALLGYDAVAAAQQTDSSSLLSTADSVLAQMSRVTGLPIKGPLNKKVITRAEINGLLQQKLHNDFTPKELEAEEASLKAFGLVPADFNLEKFLLAFYTEQAAGFYDPERKTMFIADWVKPEMQKMVLAHELTHALQDQNFDLQKFLRAVKDNDDRTAARLAVVEGYATAAMLQVLAAPMSLADMPSLEALMAIAIHQDPKEFPVFARAPFYLRYEALFPYSQGVGLMQAGLKRGGWKTLNALFTRPPQTTEQVFKPPECYAGQSAPSLSLAAPRGLSHHAHLVQLSENAMGELGYYAWLAQLTSEDEAKAVAPAWAGDRYIVYKGPEPGREALVAATRWANAKAAAAFFADTRQILTKRYPAMTLQPHPSPERLLGSTTTGEVVLLDKGSDCLWAVGVPAGKGEKLLEDFPRLVGPAPARVRP